VLSLPRASYCFLHVISFTYSCSTQTHSSSSSSSSKYVSCAKPYTPLQPVHLCICAFTDPDMQQHDNNDTPAKRLTRQSGNSLYHVQSLAGKFMLNGEEIDLGVGPQASMAHRVEALRVLLEQRLGFDTFMK